jgi:hypothetical protein
MQLRRTVAVLAVLVVALVAGCSPDGPDGPGYLTGTSGEQLVREAAT